MRLKPIFYAFPSTFLVNQNDFGLVKACTGNTLIFSLDLYFKLKKVLYNYHFRLCRILIPLDFDLHCYRPTCSDDWGQNKYVMWIAIRISFCLIAIVSYSVMHENCETEQRYHYSQWFTIRSLQTVRETFRIRLNTCRSVGR